MDAETRRIVLLLVGVSAGYAALMSWNPARPSLRDGLRCVRRYKQIWVLPAVFSLCHSGFILWLRWYEARVIPASEPIIVPWSGWQPPAWSVVVMQSRLPAVEGMAGIFNCVITAFPLSALWALLFLGNWRGYQAVVSKGLQQRLGRAGGVGVHVSLVVCALAAVFKPVIFAGLTSLNVYFGESALLKAGEIVNWLSSIFEYFLGVGVQVYLILLCFAWIRGLNFSFDSLRRFALRRFVFVAKWAAVVVAISTLGINLPLIVSRFLPAERRETIDWLQRCVEGTYWLLAAVLLAFCSMQILLVFHNETLRAACRDHFRLVRRHGLHIGWLLAISAVHFFLLAAANAFLPRALGLRTWPATLWELLLHPLLWTSLASWLLASWVCLFKRCESNRPDADELVRF